MVTHFRAMADHRRGWISRSWILVIVVTSISFTMLGVLLFENLMPFWLIGTVSVAICWLSFGSGIASIIGDARQLCKSLLASLLRIGAIVEIWSPGHWIYAGVTPITGFGNIGTDLMKLVYSNSRLFPVIFVGVWVSPVWEYVGFQVFSRLRVKAQLFRGLPSCGTTEIRAG